jgi:hypothetical protein
MSPKGNEWNKLEEAAEQGPTKLGFKILWIVLLFTVVLSTIGFIFNPFAQGARIVNKTIDADNVIYNYEWFKKTHENYLASLVKIKTAEEQVAQFKEDAGPRKDWSFEDKTEYSRIQSVVTGLKNHSEDIRAEYNAKSKMVNRKIFKGGDLPSEL